MKRFMPLAWYRGNIMQQTVKASRARVWLNKLKTTFSKPQNAILLALGILLTFSTVAPMISIALDTVTVHIGSVDSHYTGRKEGYTLYNWVDLFTGKLAKTNLWTPLLNSVLLSVFSCFGAIFYGGLFAYLVTRTNMRCKKYLSSIFIFPYIMPQWTLAVIWQNLFDSNLVTGTSDGLLTALFGVRMPLWWCQGMFPSVMVLSLHYAPFAYILIGGIFRNMDANLEEAATIMGTPRLKIFARVTLPLVKPAVLSTVLLVFSSAMGSYPVPHYLNLTTLCTKYVQMGEKRAGEASILAVIMILFGVLILIVNQRTTSGRQSYTTVTGKSGQISLVNLGKAGRHVVAAIFCVTTFFTGILPIILFAIETFLPNDSKNRRSKWAAYVNNMAFLPYLMPSLAVGVAFFVFGSSMGIFNTYLLLVLAGTVKYIPFASRSALSSMMQLSGEIEEAAIIQDIPWHKRMLNIIIPIQKSSIMSGYLLPFITCVRELTLFMLLCSQTKIITTMLDYFDEMGLYAFSSGINLILIVFILICNALINKLTGASLDKGIGGE